jgi:hypothetical protein
LSIAIRLLAAPQHTCRFEAFRANEARAGSSAEASGAPAPTTHQLYQSKLAPLACTTTTNRHKQQQSYMMPLRSDTSDTRSSRLSAYLLRQLDVPEPDPGASLINEVNGLVRQEAVADVLAAVLGGSHQGLVCEGR